MIGGRKERKAVPLIQANASSWHVPETYLTSYSILNRSTEESKPIIPTSPTDNNTIIPINVQANNLTPLERLILRFPEKLLGSKKSGNLTDLFLDFFFGTNWLFLVKMAMRNRTPTFVSFRATEGRSRQDGPIAWSVDLLTIRAEIQRLTWMVGVYGRMTAEIRSPEVTPEKILSQVKLIVPLISALDKHRPDPCVPNIKDHLAASIQAQCHLFYTHQKRLHTQRKKIHAGEELWAEPDEDELESVSDHQSLLRSSGLQAEDLQRRLIQERDREIQQIASDIRDILQMMIDAGILLTDQGELLQNSVWKIEEAKQETEAATVALRDARKEATKLGQKQCLLIAIIAGFLLCLAIVFTLILKV